MKLTTITLVALCCSHLQGSTLTATAKGPNQVNLTWDSDPNPGYGYIVEIQSNQDSRYSSFTEMKPIPVASGYTCNPALYWHGNGAGCNISDPSGGKVYNPSMNGVPAWVTEAQYSDPQDDTSAQFIATGLKQGTNYKFRVRTYVGSTFTGYGRYSNPVSVTTPIYPVRYISPTGNDYNDGSAIDDAHAWRSLGKAGSVNCGTLVLVKAGDYANEYFSLNQKCTSTNKVVLQANYGGVVRLTSNYHPDWGGAIQINGSGIVVDGITDTENYQNDYVITLGGSRNALFNMNIGPSLIPTGFGGVRIIGSNNLIYGSYIHDFGSPYDAQNGGGNGGFPLALTNGAAYNTIWSNHITRGGHDCGLILNANHTKFLNNIHDGGWGMAFEVVYGGSSNNLFEGSIGRFSGNLEAGIYKPAFELSYRQNVVRRSIFTDTGKAIEISAYDDASNNLVYNNVFYNVTNCYFQSHNQGVAAYNGVRVQNNICRFSGDATEIYLNNLTLGAVSYNSFVRMGGTGSEATVVWFQDGGWPYWNHVTLAYAESNYGAGVWVNNAALSTRDAVFVDPVKMDFHLLLNNNLHGTGTRVFDPDWGFTVTDPVDLGAYGLTAPGAVSPGRSGR